MAGPIDAPAGTSLSVPMNQDSARGLAFYKTGLRVSVLAPRGWYCLGIYGSDGQALLVSPQPIDITKISSGEPGLVGPVIEISYIFGDTSGRFEVAEIIARVFPGYKAFVDRVNEGFDLTFPSGPYPKDRLTYKSKTMVEYETSSQTDGLGTYRLVKKDGGLIDGVAILVGQTPNLVLLKVRLPDDQSKLASEIVRHVERDAFAGPGN
jgi:hypothetical protein